MNAVRAVVTEMKEGSHSEKKDKRAAAVAALRDNHVHHAHEIGTLNSLHHVKERVDVNRAAVEAMEVLGPLGAALAKLEIFRGCNGEFFIKLGKDAPRVQVAPDVVLPIDPHSGPMYIVETGALQVAIEKGLSVTFGPGEVLNVVGVVGVGDDIDRSGEPAATSSVRPGQRHSITHVAPGSWGEQHETYEPTSAKSIGAPMIYEHPRLPDKDMIFCEGFTGDELCFYNLCPFGGKPGRRRSWHGVILKRLELQALGAESGAIPLKKCDRADFMRGGATVLKISSDFINEVLTAPGMEVARAVYKANVKSLTEKWKIVVERCKGLFPCMPAEVFWNLAENSTLKVFWQDEALIREGDSGEAAEAIFVIHSGQARVEKLRTVSHFEVKQTVLGHLNPGAIIGDWCMLGASLRRPASASCSSETLKALILPAASISKLLLRFPGITIGMEGRMTKAKDFIRTKLSGKVTEELQACNLFAGSSEEFLTELAKKTQTHTLFCGKMMSQDEAESCHIVDQSSPDDQHDDEHESAKGVLFSVVFGTCALVMPGRGITCKVDTGYWFDTVDLKRSQVQILTPFVILLSVTKSAILQTSRLHPAQKQRYQSFACEPSALRFALENIKVFNRSCRAFIECICANVKEVTYMPGQTIAVMGAQDESQMFLLRRGQVAIERFATKVATLPSGSSFGELVMLGVAQSRTASVRAMTFCSLIEIPRAPFWEAIEKFPQERDDFETLAMKNMDIKVSWPVLQNVPPRLVLLLNLQATRRNCHADDMSFATSAHDEVALLVLTGEAKVVDKDGLQVATLKTGDCFNENTLIGIPNYKGHSFVPTSECELQILTQEVWKKVTEEFRHTHYESIRANILRHMARNAEIRLGVDPDSTTILRRTPMLKAAPEELLVACRKRLQNRLCKPGEAIVVGGQIGDAAHIILEGQAFIGKAVQNESRRIATFSAGDTLGEAVLLGAAKAYSTTVRAESYCIVLSLKRKDLEEALEELDPTHRQKWDSLVLDVINTDQLTMKERVKQCPAFKTSSFDFLVKCVQDADDLIIAPGDCVMTAGEECRYGESPVYVLLAGTAVIEGRLGVNLAEIAAGTLFGEAAVLANLQGRRTATVRAVRSLLHVARLHGPHMQAGLADLQDRQNFVGDLYHTRAKDNEEAMLRWETWLNQSVIPALRSSHIFQGWSPVMLKALVAPLAEIVVNASDVITRAGSPADSMLVVLEGTAEVVTRTGLKVGLLQSGGTFGAVTALGIFGQRTATLRAVTKCKVLAVPAAGLQRVLSSPGNEKINEIFQQIAKHRQEDVAKGLPLTALPFGLHAEDVSVRAVALFSDRQDLEAGERFVPLGDQGPNGVHLSIVATGRLLLEVASDSRPVMQFKPGMLLVEGMIIELGGRLQALTACTLYSFRRSDLLTAVESVPAAHSWYPRFRYHEKEAKRELRLRLQGARGASQGLVPHEFRDDLLEWKQRREKTLQKGQLLRKEMSELLRSFPSPFEASPRDGGKRAAPDLSEEEAAGPAWKLDLGAASASTCSISRSEVVRPSSLDGSASPTASPTRTLNPRPQSAASKLGTSKLGTDLIRLDGGLFPPLTVYPVSHEVIRQCKARRGFDKER